MQKHGDPMRRSADAGEAYGASIKDGIHRRTLRRKKAESATTHDARGECQCGLQEQVANEASSQVVEHFGEK